MDNNDDKNLKLSNDNSEETKTKTVRARKKIVLKTNIDQKEIVDSINSKTLNIPEANEIIDNKSKDVLVADEEKKRE